MKHTLLIKDWLSSFLSLLFPRCCVVCGRPLAKGEECICTECNINLPRTNYHLRKDNPVIPLERATSFFFYEKGSDFRLILHRLKYGGQKEIGAIMGRYMAAELLSSNFFQGIDVIIPIPLHKKKQQIRGYNQSEWIARGIAAVTYYVRKIRKRKRVNLCLNVGIMWKVSLNFSIPKHLQGNTY